MLKLMQFLGITISNDNISQPQKSPSNKYQPTFENTENLFMIQERERKISELLFIHKTDNPVVAKLLANQYPVENLIANNSKTISKLHYQ